MYFSFREIIFRSTAQIYRFSPWILPELCNLMLLDLRYLCRHYPLFYHLNLISCHYWGWQGNIYFLVNNFVWHTFSMSKSSIKTKTMTDMTESTELLAFRRQKDGYKVTVKISLCICFALSWDEPKVRQSLLDSQYPFISFTALGRY